VKRTAILILIVPLTLTAAFGSPAALGAIIVDGKTYDDATLEGVVHFQRITSGDESIPDTPEGNATAAAILSQLEVDVYGLGAASGKVLFLVKNLAPDGYADSTIKSILFDDGTLIDSPVVYNTVTFPTAGDIELGLPTSKAVDFEPIDVSKTPTLPGGNGPPLNFQTTAGFGAIADSPCAFRGLDPGEAVGLVFNLLPNTSATDTFNALGFIPEGGQYNTSGVDDFSLRIGLHVISEGPDGCWSDSYLNTTPVPEPTSLLVWALGLSACVGFHGQRRRRRVV